MIKVVPFKAEHLLEIVDENHPLMNPKEIKEIAEFKEKNGYAVTMISAMGQILACGGVIRMNERMGVVWSYMTQEVKKFPIFLFKSTKKLLEEAQERFDLKRLELNTCTEEDCKFALRLGFRHEGPIYNFGKNGETFQRFSLCH